MLRTYVGGCHCQLVRFEARIDFSNGTSKCNCSFCSRLRFWHVKVRREEFRLLSDETALTEYQGKNPVAHIRFANGAASTYLIAWICQTEQGTRIST